MADRGPDGGDFAARLKFIVVEIFIDFAVVIGGAALGGVFDKAAAGVTVLSAEGVVDDSSFLDGFVGGGALLGAVVTADFAIRCAVEEVFKIATLASIDARAESAIGLDIALGGRDEGGEGE